VLIYFGNNRSRGRVLVTRHSHKVEHAGSNPVPAKEANGEDLGSSPRRNDHLVYGACSNGCKDRK
jgi:hypothetical protein